MSDGDEWEQIGVVGVDSGQLMICDPSYVDDQWVEAPFEDIRIFEDVVAGELYRFRVDFQRFDEPLAHYEGRTPNELVASGQWKRRPPPAPSGQFSYRGACEATLTPEGHGQLLYQKGHPGVAVAFSTAYGDGVYPVFARRDADGAIVEVRIIMGDDEGDEE